MSENLQLQATPWLECGRGPEFVVGARSAQVLEPSAQVATSQATGKALLGGGPAHVQPGHR
eukprot:2642597-Alexandrium_andersonii.AAC.1